MGLLFLIGISIGGGIYTWLKVEEAKGLVQAYQDVVLPNVFVNGTDVSQMSLEEVQFVIESEMSLIRRRSITVKIDEAVHEVQLSQFDPTFEKNSESLAREIVDFNHDLNWLELASQIKQPLAYEFEIKYDVDEGLIYDFAKQLEREVYEPKIESTLNMVSYGSFVIEEGKDGVSLNSEWLANLLKDEIEGGGKDPIVIEMNKTTISREEKTDDLKTVDTLIASYSSLFNPNTLRAINVQLAAKKVDQTVLRSGDTFSYGEAIEPVDYAHGFVNATTFYLGQKVPAVGGGICQVSSTLYNAQLLAGIVATKRQNHSLSVGYVPLGQDATYSEGSIAYEFINTLDYPIYIHAYTEGGVLTVELWSNSDALNGIRYYPKTDISEGGLRADTTLYGYDASGNMVYEQFLHTSRYQPHK
ncbi:MAG TPA: vanomycin resistance protein VanB [Firmicutes bacterium]|nr:vanomycin resistance protein VanB [Bacillota bacterium]